MAELVLSHYTGKPFEFDPDRSYEQSTRAMKPHGLWLSVDGEFGWPEWCLGERFGVSSLKHQAPFRLTTDANVLVLSTPEELDAFTAKYGGEITREFLFIDWPQVAQDYDGLIITPYLWQRRFVNWYYGWDCASGCIWNLTAIERIST